MKLANRLGKTVCDSLNLAIGMKVSLAKTRKLQSALKRFVDVIVSIVGLVILSPMFLVIAILIKLHSKGSVFFRQERVGKKGQLYKTWKFRTMIEGAIRKGLGYNVAKDDYRITKVGRILRNWGLDEFPQLINVLNGEMSIVGPRPTLKYQVDGYNDFQRKRLLVKPGITGWALIHGRNLLSWKERIRYDVWYVENWSLWLDFKIMLETLRIVLIARTGVYSESGVNYDFVSDNEWVETKEEDESMDTED